MPIHGYPGNVITANPTAPTSSVASGVWTTEQQLIATAAGNWPFTIPTQQISRSLRFNSADSTYLNKTFSTTPTNRAKKTVSCWYKRSNLSSTQNLFSSYNGGGQDGLYITSGDSLSIYAMNGGVSGTVNGVLRDVSAWYHIVYVIDTTQATAGDRLKIWINGVNFPSASWPSYSAPSLNSTADILFFQSTEIGRDDFSSSGYLNGYLTETYFIDGQALTPSSFGQTNASTGVWEPIPYTGTYGTNGFYLNFSDNSNTTAATLGKDYSGNGNNWTPNNFSVTAGAGNDSLVDSPTSYGTDTGVGGTVRGNYATLNPLNTQISGSSALQNGNLTLNATSATYVNSKSTLAASIFNNYCEMTVTTQSNSNGLIGIGVGNSIANIATGDGSYITYRQNGTIIQYPGNVTLATVASYTQGDVIGMTIDSTNVKFYKNNSLQGTYAHGFTGDYFVVGMAYNSGGTAVLDFNFGQRAFAYTAPSGFKALCTQNLPTPTIGATSTTQANDYMNVVLYTGTGSSLGVTGVGFQPDWVWIKGRSGATDHGLYDAVRGVQKQLESNTTTAETTETTGLTAFGTDGFTVGALAQLNTSSATYVAWNWKANGAGSSNTDGTITSTVSASTTSGFSIVSFTSTGSQGTVGHGLGIAPSMIIMKQRPSGSAWSVYHVSIGNTKRLVLNTTDAEATDSIWGNTTPTSTVFTQNVSASTPTAIAYCFAPVAGYSAFGSYTGNGSTDGPMIFTNFRPRFVMVKRTDGLNEWLMHDSARSTYNVVNARLSAQGSAAESTSPDALDFTSNGFKLRTTDGGWNASGGTYIYMAFAESPFKYSLAR